MNAAGYAILAYALGLGLMAGYGVRLWVLARAVARREKRRG